jgi:hypothetical protein
MLTAERKTYNNFSKQVIHELLKRFCLLQI